MNRRLTALILLAGASAVWLLIGQSARRDRDLSRAAYAKARQERQDLRERLASFERQPMRPQAGAPGARVVRRALIEAARGLSLGGLRIDASAAAKGAVRGRLGAAGRTADVLELTDRLTRPEGGLELRRLDLSTVSAEDSSVRLEVEVEMAGGSS